LRRTDLRRQPSRLLRRRDRGVPVSQPGRHDPENGEHARQVAKPPSFAQEVDRLSYQDVREIECAGIERGRAKQQRSLTFEGAVSDHRAELVHRSRGQRERISVDVRDEQARVGRVRRASAPDGLEKDIARVVVHAKPGRPEGGEPQQFDVQAPVACPPRRFRDLDHRPGGPRSSERAYMHDRVDRNVDPGDARALGPGSSRSASRSNAVTTSI
jgi:hypothetical protein